MSRAISSEGKPAREPAGPADLRARLANLSPVQRAALEKRLQHRTPSIPEQGIVRRQDRGPCALSFCQQRLWFLDQLSPHTSTYNAPFALRLRGPLDLDALRQAVDTVFVRHEVLRTRFACVCGAPVQVVGGVQPGVLRYIDLRDVPETQRAAAAQRLITEEARRPFDLARDLLMRCTLLQLAEEESVFLHVAHHIAWDYRSKLILYEELAALYEAYSAGRPPALPELPIQYADFALWQRQRLQGKDLEKLVAYWQERLAGAVMKLELPADRSRPRMQSLRGAKYSCTLPAALVESAQALSRKVKGTLFMTLLAAFKAFLHSYTGQSDLIVGSPIAGRDRVDTEPLIGFFINTLVLRTDLSGNPTFCELLSRVRETTLGAYANQEMPFEKLVEIGCAPRDLSRNPLFQVNFRVASAAPVVLKLAGLTIQPLELIDTATSKFDLALEIATLEGLSGYWEYSTDLFEADTVARMSEDFLRVLRAVLAQPDRPLQELPPLAEITTQVRAREKERKAAQSRPKSLRDVRRKTVPASARPASTRSEPERTTMSRSVLAEFALRGLKMLSDEDPALWEMLEREYDRQANVLAMVAASSVADPGVLACEGMVTTNVTTEGYPGARFHAGCEWVDQIERLAIERAKKAFNARYANVQPHSGSSANEIVMFALLRPGDTILGLALDAGGHLTHGSKASVSGQYFNAVAYGLDAEGLLDYDQVRRLAREHKPRLIVAGASSYPRTIDFARFREIADEVGAYVLADISHIAGLVVAGEHPSPIDHAHFTTTSTYKQLYGPRGGLILIGKDHDQIGPDGKRTLAEFIQKAVFPYFQGTPNLSAIAAKARALAVVATPAFQRTAWYVVACAKVLARCFVERGYRVLTGGTDNHMVLMDVLSKGVTGVVAERALEECNIVVNKNKIPGDKKPALVTSGMRLGTNSLALRGMTPREMPLCAELIHRVLSAVEVLGPSEYRLPPAVQEGVRAEVKRLCRDFPLPHYPLATPRGADVTRGSVRSQA